MTSNPAFSSIFQPQQQVAPQAPAPIRMLPKVEVSASTSFLTLVKVEFRKAFDTRAGRVLFIVMIGLAVAATALGVAIFRTLADAAKNSNWQLLAGMPGFAISILMPVIAILLFTQEWGQRTALTTYTLEPRRARVLGAKAVVAVLLGLVSFVIQQVFIAVGSITAGAVHGIKIDWSFGWKAITLSLVALMSSVLMAMAFALLLMNTAAAIVLINVIPMLMGATIMLPKKFAELAVWVNPNSVTLPLADPNATATMWAQMVTSIIVWIVIPSIIGVYRHLRAEAK